MGKRHAGLKYCYAVAATLAGCASTPQSVVKQSPSDPAGIAMAWCATRSMEKADIGNQELETFVKSWEDPQVLRVFLDGTEYRAVVADGLGDELRQAAILTIARSEGTWAISHIESGQTDLLWPTY